MSDLRGFFFHGINEKVQVLIEKEERERKQKPSYTSIC